MFLHCRLISGGEFEDLGLKGRLGSGCGLLLLFPNYWSTGGRSPEKCNYMFWIFLTC